MPAQAHTSAGSDLELPRDRLIVVSGISGSGKSSLVLETLYPALARDVNGTPAAVGPYRRLTGTGQVKGDVVVVPMDGWRRDMWWDETGLPWRNPSPNIRSKTIRGFTSIGSGVVGVRNEIVPE